MPEHHGPARGGNEQEADPGMLAQPGEQPGMGSLDGIYIGAAGQVWEVDQAEIARAEHDRLASGGVRLLAGRRRVHAGRGVAAPLRPGLSGGVGFALVPVALPRDRFALCGKPDDQLPQGFPVALQEGRALTLPVIGQHDDAVGPIGLPHHGEQHLDDVVEFGQHRKGLRPGNAGVVRHLVIADQVDVDDTAPLDQIADHRGGGDVGGEHGRERPHKRIDPTPRHPRLDVLPLLPQRLAQFPLQFREHPDERAQRARRVREIVAVAGTAAKAGAAHAADDEHVVVRAAGEQVAAARTVVRQQATECPCVRVRAARCRPGC